ncbi:hypothetical protein HYR65_01735 [Candidatus Azambacteria bacterium]|nr:hypothetical protein [Candidatus Azambacteria bacterium]
MKPVALLIVIAIFAGIMLVFAPAILKDSIASFPLFQALSEQRQQTAVSVENATIFRSIDGGKIWFPQVAIDADKNIPPVTILHLVLDHFDSNILYAGTEGDGLYKSVNNGQNWEKLYDRNRILADNASVYRVAQDPKNVNRIYIAAFQNKYGVFLKSEDGGVSFTQTYISQLENYPVYAIAIHPVFSNIVYIGTAQGGFFASEDFGETWQVLEWLTGPVTDIAVNQATPSEMYAVANGRGLFRSQDGGRTWKGFSSELSRISANSSVTMFRTDPQNQNTLYLALANGLVKSENRGSTWKFMNILIPPNALPVDAVAVNPRDTFNVHVGVGALMYMSDDGGINWSVQKLNTTKRVSTIVIDPKDPQNMFLGMRVPKKR